MTATATEPKVVDRSVEVDHGYRQLENLIFKRVGENKGVNLFTTDADEAAIWEAYLSNISPEYRQHYNCNCCRRFLQKYASLATIDASGRSESFLFATANKWEDFPFFFYDAIAALRAILIGSKVTGVFLSDEKTWGIPQTKEWTHLSGTSNQVFKDKLLTPFQAMADKKQDFGIMVQGIQDYSHDIAKEALRVLKSEALYRSEKAEAIAEWFESLHSAIKDAKGKQRNNLIWLALAKAPPGFCHIRSTIISTLMDDIKAGLSFEVVADRWAKKLHPLQYQRPTAPPKNGAIENAEKLVAQLGIEGSLRRRAARLEDVLVKLWVPKQVVDEVKEEKKGGVFGHLKTNNKAEVKQLEIPATEISWEKFQKTVLPFAIEMELNAPGLGNYCGLVTAVEIENSPPILQWDGLEGCERNPVSWYVYVSGSRSADWSLFPGWTKVNAVFPAPPHWQRPDLFGRFENSVQFALEGCVDMRKCGLSLFPEILKSELRAVRSVIEAHSQEGELENVELGNANGIVMSKSNSSGVMVRVRTDKTGTAWNDYKITRWE